VKVNIHTFQCVKLYLKLFSVCLAPSNLCGVISKTIEVCLEKEGNSFGFVLRGTESPSDSLKCLYPNISCVMTLELRKNT